MRRPGGLARAASRLWRAKFPLAAILVMLAVCGSAAFAPALAPQDPNRQNIIARLRPPMAVDRQGRIQFVLGSDSLGRDIASRLLYGARVTAVVGLTAVVIGGCLGTLLGVLAGYAGGAVDAVIMRIADVQLAFPFILLAIMVLVVLGRGLPNLILVLGVGQWVTYARIARAQTLAVTRKEYVEAARAVGARHARVLLFTVLPNIVAPLIVVASFNLAGVILSEAALSFLGLGAPPTVPSWGGMLAESRDQLLAGRWWLAILPGLAIALTALSCNVLGDWLRDELDPRLKEAG